MFQGTVNRSSLKGQSAGLLVLFGCSGFQLEIKMAVSGRGSFSLGQKMMKALGAFAPKHSGHQKIGNV